MSDKPEVLTDIATAAQTIEVFIDHKGTSPFETEGFLDQVVNALTCARHKGIKFVSVGQLATCLKVVDRDLDEWAKNQPRLIRRQGKEVVYYGLAKVKLLKDATKEEFEQNLLIVLTEDDKQWKSLGYIAKQLEWDEEELKQRLDSCTGVVRRINNAKKVFYGLEGRLNKKSEAVVAVAKKPKKVKTRSLITRDEVLALGMLHLLSDSFIKTMNFYGNRVAVRHKNAYAHFATAQKEISSGIALLMDDLGIKDKHMPDLEKI